MPCRKVTMLLHNTSAPVFHLHARSKGSFDCDVFQGQHFHPHPQAPWVKLTVTLTLAPVGGGGNVDPWRPWDFLEALDGQLRCRRRFCFFRKMAPYFWKPWMANYVAAGAFFFLRKMPPEGDSCIFKKRKVLRETKLRLYQNGKPSCPKCQ